MSGAFQQYRKSGALAMLSHRTMLGETSATSVVALIVPVAHGQGQQAARGGARGTPFGGGRSESLMSAA
jgi:hypothetical protein